MIKLAVGLSVLFIYLLMVMGNIVTTTGSGLACPDWPLCYGSITPPLELQIWIEWGHRLLGSITSVLILSSTILVWRNHRGILRRLTASALGLLVVGVVFGGIIVMVEAPLLKETLHILIISFHIIISTIIFSLMITTFRTIQNNAGENERKIYPILLTLLFTQVIIGIFVRYGQASLACPDFPLCRGELFPTLVDFKITIHFIHRFVALMIFLTVTGNLIFAIKTRQDIRNSLITFTLVIVQASFGIKIVWTNMFLPYVVLHGATGFLLLGWLVYRSMPLLVKQPVTDPVTA